MQKKEGRLVYYPMKFFPSFWEIERLEILQDELRYTNAQIELQERNNKYNLLIRKQHLANMLRSKWEVIDCQNETKGEE